MASAEEARNWAPPEEITGLGDEAFWVPNQFGGALYVLKQECHIRISISGSSDPETKRHNSRALAAFVLDRL